MQKQPTRCVNVVITYSAIIILCSHSSYLPGRVSIFCFLSPSKSLPLLVPLGNPLHQGILRFLKGGGKKGGCFQMDQALCLEFDAAVAAVAHHELAVWLPEGQKSSTHIFCTFSPPTLHPTALTLRVWLVWLIGWSPPPRHSLHICYSAILL